MIYINHEYTKKVLKNSFKEIISQLEYVVDLKKENKIHQPLKPYLRFQEKENRAIAMPAYVGGKIDTFGIKWITSFPNNINKNSRRANCVTVLNSTKTGEVMCIINSPELSIYRTASVSGMIIKKFFADNQTKKMNAGIIGYGPIGKKHEEMLTHLFENRIATIYLYDLKNIKTYNRKSCVCNSWEEVYEKADILIICTTTSKPYLNRTPQGGKLTLNISLRDFDINCIDLEETVIIVDDWNEVNREHTNIEELSRYRKLEQKDCIDIYDYLHNQKTNYDSAIFFNPMGLAIFDITVGKYIYDRVTKVKGF